MCFGIRNDVLNTEISLIWRPWLERFHCTTYYDNIEITAPSAAPTSIRGFAIDHSSISLEWDVPPTLQLHGILAAYVVNVTERETGITFEVNTTTTSIVLDSLHPDYVYECRVAAVTIAPGPFSTIFAVQVLMAGKILKSFLRKTIQLKVSLFCIAPSGPPDNITATAVTATQILVTWDPPLPQFRNGPILAYNLTVTDTTMGMVVWSSIVLTTSDTVSSLRAFTTYNFTLSARTSVGYGPNDTAAEITLQDSKLLSLSLETRL